MAASSARPDVGYHWLPPSVPREAAEMLRVCSESDQHYSCAVFRTEHDYSVLLHNMTITPPVTDYLKREIKCNCLVTGLGEAAARRLAIAAVEHFSSVSARLANRSVISVREEDFSFDAAGATQMIESMMAEAGDSPLGYACYPMGISGYSIGERTVCSDGWLRAISHLRKYCLSDRPGLRVVISEFGRRNTADLDLSLEIAPMNFCQPIRNLREIGQAVFIGSLLVVGVVGAWLALRNKS